MHPANLIRNMHGVDPTAPVVIGGVGGSGTRVVAQIVEALGVCLGADLNPAYDNLAFTLLFRRPPWYQRIQADSTEIARGFEILARSMTSRSPFSPAQRAFITRAAWDMVRLRKHRPLWDRISWPLHRAAKLVHPHRPLPAGRGWGWKEPNSLVYVADLAAHFDNGKYIHVIRHGLDMAFSANRQPLIQWGWLYGITRPADPRDRPGAMLQYWAEANRRVLLQGVQFGPGRFFLLHFDRLCRAPDREIRRLLSFLEVPLTSVDLDALCAIPHLPASTGRHRDHDLSSFRPADLQMVSSLGFEIDV